MRQKSWLELTKDCDYMINYCLDKANIVINALNKKLINLVILLII